jgi:hypothetical protein
MAWSPLFSPPLHTLGVCVQGLYYPSQVLLDKKYAHVFGTAAIILQRSPYEGVSLAHLGA